MAGIDHDCLRRNPTMRHALFSARRIATEGVCRTAFVPADAAPTNSLGKSTRSKQKKPYLRGKSTAMSGDFFNDGEAARSIRRFVRHIRVNDPAGERYLVRNAFIDGPGSMTLLGTTVTVVVPGSHLMSSLLGSRDEFVRVIEQAFPSVTISVRGNEINLSGEGAEDVGRLFEELVLVLQRGQHL